jgi:hypothetical protein
MHGRYMTSKEARQEKQQLAYDFLFDKFETQATFTKGEFQAHTGWPDNSFNTYWSKQYSTLLVPIDSQNYRVSEAFRRVLDWRDFQTHVTQNRRVSSDYSTFTYENVVLFEFFMPLTNEGSLRQSLDALFFKDSVESRLRSSDQSILKRKFPPAPTETDSDYMNRICEFVSNTFGGYSISHVNGRYRADILKTHAELFSSETKWGNGYLVDETTAVVKFIFPVGESVDSKFVSDTTYFETLAESHPNTDALDSAEQVRWLFYILFVQSIVQVVNGEDEIWLLESGLKNRLHIWRVKD